MLFAVEGCTRTVHILGSPPTPPLPRPLNSPGVFPPTSATGPQAFLPAAQPRPRVRPASRRRACTCCSRRSTVSPAPASALWVSSTCSPARIRCPRRPADGASRGPAAPPFRGKTRSRVGACGSPKRHPSSHLIGNIPLTQAKSRQSAFRTCRSVPCGPSDSTSRRSISRTCPAAHGGSGSGFACRHPLDWDRESLVRLLLLLGVCLARRDGLLEPWPDVRLTHVPGDPEAAVGPSGTGAPARDEGRRVAGAAA